MSVVYEQDIEFNGTKLTVNPQFNETEVTRCKVNETDVIHKYTISGLDMKAECLLNFYSWTDSSCDWTDSGTDMTIDFDFYGSNLVGISSVTLSNWRLDIRSSVRGDLANSRSDYSESSHTPITSPTATFERLIANYTTSNDDSFQRYFYIDVTATFIITTAEGSVTVTFSGTSNAQRYTLDGDYYLTATQVLGDRVQEY